MKRTLKKAMSVLLAFTLLFGSLAFGLSDLNFVDFAVKASAEDATEFTEGYYTFTVDTEGNATITDVSHSIEGDVIIPSTLDGHLVTSIGEVAFMGCDDFYSVIIPENVTSIGENAFSYCDNLESVTFPDGLITIDDYAFAYCAKLKNMVFPDNIMSIGYNAFTNTGLYNDEANWTDSVFYIGTYLIKADYTATGSHSIKPGTKFIAEYAFSCSSFESIEIPDSVVIIDNYAFHDCDSLTSITIPDSVTHIGYGVFTWSDYLTKIVVDSENTSYSSDEYGVLFNKNKTELIQYPMGNIRTSYTIPYGVKCIGDCAFEDWNGSLLEITIPDSVTSIGFGAFMRSSGLIDITIPDSVISIGDYAFRNCCGLTNVTIGNNVKSIGDMAFECCESLTSITLPDSVETIGNQAFLNSATGIINIPNSVTYIGNLAFLSMDLEGIMVDPANTVYSSDEYGVLFNKNKTELIQYPGGNSRPCYEIPDCVISIADKAFGACDGGLASLEIPDGVKSIGDCAFSGVFTSISIPKSVINIGNCAFTYCSLLENIVVDSENTVYSSDDGVLFNKDKTELIQYPIGNIRTSYEIPDSVVIIDDYAFCECDNLTNITIPDSVTSIGDDAFCYCDSLTSVTIGNGVTSIGSVAFYHCSGLTDVYYTGTKEEWEKIWIGSLNEPLLDATIHFAKTSSPGTPGDPTPSVCGHETTSTVTIAATCKVAGMEYVVCANCGEKVGEPVVLPVIPHTTVTVVTVEPTCTKEGKEHDECSACGDILSAERTTAKLLHTPGEWETETEPTAEKEGKRVRKCTVCGETADEEIIPKKTVVTDDNTGVAIEINDGDYDGDVSIEVKESFDGAAFNLINTETDAAQSLIYDIKLTVDGKETQPNGKVTVRIPVPDGYDPNRSFVYHVDTKTGKLEKMNTRFENGYLEFETTHFSYYAVVEEAKTSLEIRKPSTSTVKYGETLILHADFTNIPEGATIEWSVEGKGVTIVPSADGKTCAVTSTATGDVTITAKYVDVNGVEYISEQEIKSNASFWQKIVSFFKNLFGISRIIEQVIKF